MMAGEGLGGGVPPPKVRTFLDYEVDFDCFRGFKTHKWAVYGLYSKKLKTSGIFRYEQR